MSVLTLLALVSSAHAYIYVGNPDVTFHLELPSHTLDYADADVDYVRVHKCGGGYEEFDVSATVDLTAGFTVAISPGNLCGVSVKWDTDVLFGGTSWDAEYTEGHTSVTLDGSPSTVWTGMTPFSMTSGEFPGGVPRLVVSVQ